MKKIKKLGVVAKPTRQESKDVVLQLIAYAKRKEITIVPDIGTAKMMGVKEGYEREKIAGKVDLLLVIGGDGTLLSVSKSAAKARVPILGVNLGSLGFLTEISLKELYTYLDEALSGKVTLDKRMMLKADIIRKDKIVSSHTILNDIVINKAALARIIDLGVEIDGYYVTTYKSDGLIISTPTGSTAYSLSAGGPIIYPSMKAFVITPICPHTLTNRPLVVSDEVEIKITLLAGDGDVFATLDGQLGFPIKPKDVIQVVKSKDTVSLIRARDRNYFELLRRKLKWGER